MAGSNQKQFDINSVPKYRDLPLLEGTEERHAWDVFGPGDNLGTINYLTPEHVLESMKLVKRGVSFNLDLPLDQPERPQDGSEGRVSYTHNIYRTRGGGDDSLDNFYLQSSSQFDSLAHVRFGSRGFYQGVTDEELDTGRLGIDHWSQHGISGRAVLIDLPRFVGPSRMNVTDPQPGLDGMRETAEWMWDHKITFFAGDNIACEALPPVPLNFQHRRMIPLFGMTIGEIWDFEELAEDCARDGVYEMFLVAKPLNLPRGVGSPINALAFK